MTRVLLFYYEHVRAQVLAVAVPYVGYVVAWFARSEALAEWTLYGILVTEVGILAAAVGHRFAKDRTKARSSLDAFCITFLLAFFTVLTLSPLSFRREGHYDPDAQQSFSDEGSVNGGK
jgi:hypothetical protein